MSFGGQGSRYGDRRRSRDETEYGASKYRKTDDRTSVGGSRYDNDPIYQGYSGIGGYVQQDLTDEKVLYGRPNTGINFDKYDKISVNVEGSNPPNAINSFEEAQLHPTLLKNISMAQYAKPTPVQRYSIPIVLSQRDLMASAQTGSGKTGGFLFPIIDGLLKEGLNSARPQYGQASLPYAVVLAPTRELANQIFLECQKFIHHTKLRALCLYGGTSVNVQCRQVEKGVDIVVATPGRLKDLLDRQKISFKNVRYLCLDEADRMLDMGFEKDIRNIVEKRDMPPINVRRTLMFSATFPKPILRLASDFLGSHLFLKVGQVGSMSENIIQNLKWAEESDKPVMLTTELKAVVGRTLVFVETKRKADQIASSLNHQGFTSAPIHGDLKQYEREYALDDFRKGRIKVLVATDVAARGLDIESVEHVINYDLPNQIDDYVHRIGRTGRAGNIGVATAFYNSKSSGIARELIERLREAKQQVPEWLEKERGSSGGRGGRGGHGGRGGYGNRGGNSNGSRSSYGGNRGHSNGYNTSNGYYAQNQAYNYNHSGYN